MQARHPLRGLQGRAMSCWGLQGSMTVDLPPYQKRALAWMLHREQPDARPAVAGGLLADDQGLGKTVTAIALLLSHPPQQVCHCGPCPLL